MFNDSQAFNGNISNWDTSKVTSMENMFARTVQAVKFNNVINGWDTSKVTTMKNMFAGAIEFNNAIMDW
jgi:surface protein